MNLEEVKDQVVATVKGVAPTNLYQTICTLYDLRPKLNADVLQLVAQELDLPCPPVENNKDLSTLKFLTAALAFVLYLYDSNQEEFESYMEKLVALLGGIELDRQLDKLLAKIYFFYSLIGPQTIPTLLAIYRRTSDLHLHHTQATTVNCLLRHYVNTGSFDLALSFLVHSTFPKDVSTTQLAQYHFYVGHLHAVTLEYSEAQYHLQLSLRRAPQSKYAAHFRALAQKHLIVVMMLQGKVPPRSMLIDESVYLELARSIRRGDVEAFRAISNNQQFKDDGLAVLVPRLRGSVILAGLTTIAQCYSRISFEDIARFLKIENPEDAESYCAKVAADGLIEATIDHEHGWLICQRSKDNGSGGFSERINKDIVDCFGIREDTQRTMHEESITD